MKKGTKADQRQQQTTRLAATEGEQEGGGVGEKRGRRDEKQEAVEFR